MFCLCPLLLLLLLRWRRRLSHHATFSSFQAAAQVPCAYARVVIKTPERSRASKPTRRGVWRSAPRDRDVRHLGSKRSPDVHGSPCCLTFWRRCLTTAAFFPFTLFSCSFNRNSSRPLELLQSSLIAERSPSSLSFTPNHLPCPDAHLNLAPLHIRRQYRGPGDRGRLAGRR